MGRGQGNQTQALGLRSARRGLKGLRGQNAEFVKLKDQLQESSRKLAEDRVFSRLLDLVDFPKEALLIEAAKEHLEAACKGEVYHSDQLVQAILEEEWNKELSPAGVRYDRMRETFQNLGKVPEDPKARSRQTAVEAITETWKPYLKAVDALIKMEVKMELQNNRRFLYSAQRVQAKLSASYLEQTIKDGQGAHETKNIVEVWRRIGAIQRRKTWR